MPTTFMYLRRMIWGQESPQTLLLSVSLLANALVDTKANGE